VRVHGGSEGGSGGEAGGGDACLEMRKVKRGCIIDDEGAQDESGSQMLRVSVARLCYHYPQLHETQREGEKKHIQALTLPRHKPPIPSPSPSSSIRRSTQGTLESQSHVASHAHGEHQKEVGECQKCYYSSWP